MWEYTAGYISVYEGGFSPHTHAQALHTTHHSSVVGYRIYLSHPQSLHTLLNPAVRNSSTACRSWHKAETFSLLGIWKQAKSNFMKCTVHHLTLQSLRQLRLCVCSYKLNQRLGNYVNNCFESLCPYPCVRGWMHVCQHGAVKPTALSQPRSGSCCRARQGNLSPWLTHAMQMSWIIMQIRHLCQWRI